MIVIVLWLVVVTETLIYLVSMASFSSDGWDGTSIGIL